MYLNAARYFVVEDAEKKETPLAGSEARTQAKQEQPNPGILNKIKNAIFG